MSTLAWLGFAFAALFTVAWLGILVWETLAERRNPGSSDASDREPTWLSRNGHRAARITSRRSSR